VLETGTAASLPRTPPVELVLTLSLSADARRYFKQSEIVLYRQAPEITAPPQQQQIQQQPQQQQQVAAAPA